MYRGVATCAFNVWKNVWWHVAEDADDLVPHHAQIDTQRPIIEATEPEFSLTLKNGEVIIKGAFHKQHRTVDVQNLEKVTAKETQIGGEEHCSGNGPSLARKVLEAERKSGGAQRERA